MRPGCPPLLLVSVLVLRCAAAPAAEPARPNLVVILADDLGYGDLGCFGHPKFKTPVLDRMAAEGVRLTQFTTPMPFCAPSRAALLTGRYPFRNAVTGNPCPDAGVNDLGIADSEVTLAEVLKAAGYATCCIGKWHLGHKPEFYPRRHGFGEYYGILYSNDMRPVQLMDGEAVAEYPVVQCTLTRRYTERALKFIDRNKGRPFFLYLPHAMPHKPLAASEAYYQKSGSGLYADVIAELDWSVGQILARLKQLALDEKTLVIFTSDNGPWFGGSTGGLRGMKGTTWEGGIRVPMIARWPGRIAPGRTSDALAGTIDIFPTVLAAAGVPLPEGVVLDGKSILGVLTSGAPSPHEAIFAMSGPRLATIRSGCWKLHVLAPGQPRWLDAGDAWVDPRAPDGVTILAPYEQYKPAQFPGVASGDPPQKLMLFDLGADPAEQHNLAEKHSEVVARLKGLFDQTAADVPAAPPKPARKRAKTAAKAAQ